MALYYSKGKISFISEVKSGTSQSGFNWKNCDLTIEVPQSQGSIIKQVFRVTGDKVDEVLKYKVGDTVQVGFIIYAREWNNRLFNNVELVTITDETGAVKPKEQPVQEQPQQTPTDEEGPDLPF